MSPTSPDFGDASSPRPLFQSSTAEEEAVCASDPSAARVAAKNSSSRPASSSVTPPFLTSLSLPPLPQSSHNGFITASASFLR